MADTPPPRVVYFLLEYTETGYALQKPSVISDRLFSSKGDAARFGIVSYILNKFSSPYDVTMAEIGLRDISHSPADPTDRLAKLHQFATNWRDINLFHFATITGAMCHKTMKQLPTHMLNVSSILSALYATEEAIKADSEHTNDDKLASAFSAIVNLSKRKGAYSTVRIESAVVVGDCKIWSLVWRKSPDCTFDPQMLALVPTNSTDVAIATACAVIYAVLSTMRSSMAQIGGAVREENDLRRLAIDWWWYLVELSKTDVTDIRRCTEIVLLFVNDDGIKKKKLEDTDNILLAIVRAIKIDIEKKIFSTESAKVEWLRLSNEGFDGGVCENLTMCNGM